MRRSLWLKKLNRKEWTPGPGARVGSEHFISRKHTAAFDQHNPDWAPTLNMGYEAKNIDVGRYQRSKRRRVANFLQPDHLSPAPLTTTTTNPPVSDSCLSEVACQTVLNIESLEQDNKILRSEVKLLEQRTHKITADLFKNYPDMLKFYTGLPNWTVFSAIFALVSPSLQQLPNSKLSTFEMVAVFFLKDCLNLY